MTYYPVIAQRGMTSPICNTVSTLLPKDTSFYISRHRCFPHEVHLCSFPTLILHFSYASNLDYVLVCIIPHKQREATFLSAHHSFPWVPLANYFVFSNSHEDKPTSLSRSESLKLAFNKSFKFYRPLALVKFSTADVYTHPASSQDNFIVHSRVCANPELLKKSYLHPTYFRFVVFSISPRQNPSAPFRQR